MNSNQKIIYLHPAAPLKPEINQPCNGCGVCCAIETCPVARVFLLQWKGPCRALQWQESAKRYVCGMMEQPRDFLPALPRRMESWFRRCISRWIAAGIGCDANVDVTDIATSGASKGAE